MGSIGEVEMAGSPRASGDPAEIPSAPTFMFKRKIANFFPNAKKHVSLLFHEGATIPGKSGLLESDGRVARAAHFIVPSVSGGSRDQPETG